MALYRPVPFSHHIIEKHMTHASYVIDATVGHGFDTYFIASNLGKNGRIFGFDIQQAAIDETAQRIKDINCRKKLFLQSHTTMFQTLCEYEGKIDLILFNLGFLPHHKQSLTTNQHSTYRAILQAIALLRRKGLLLIVAYPGHPEGFNEYQLLINLFSQANTNLFYITTYQLMDADKQAPVVFMIEKKY